MTDPAPPPAPPAPPPAPPAPPAWHNGIAADVIGHAQNKGWLTADPKEGFAKAVAAHAEAQKYIGVPTEKLLRMPEASAPPEEVSAFWQRLGTPKEAKEYDLSGIKFGEAELEQGFTDALRGAFHNARVPKDQAPTIAKAVVDYLEREDRAEQAMRTESIATEKAALERNWGANAKAYAVVAETTLAKLGQAAGLSADQTKAAWDALSKVGGVGAAAAMEMLRVIGSKIGEDKFVTLGGGNGDNQVMTRDAAKAEIDQLKKDKAFVKRYTDGGFEENRRMKALHKIAYGEAAA